MCLIRYSASAFCFLLFQLCLLGCQEKKTETAYQIKAAADESFMPLMNAELDAFQMLYESREVNIQYMPEDEAIRDFISGDLDFIVIGRELDSREREKLEKRGFSYRSYLLGKDALSFIVHPKLGTDCLQMEKLNELFTGKADHWIHLSDSLPGENIQIVLDGNNSSNFNFLDQRFDFRKNRIKAYAAGSTEKVIDFVSQNKYALGVIPQAWISNSNSPWMKSCLQKVEVLSLKKTGSEEKLTPFQEHLYNENYPFTRPIYIITKSASGNEGTLLSFLLSERGQRILLKSGILPAKLPGREIQIN